MGTGMGTLHSPASGQPDSRQDSLGDTQILHKSPPQGPQPPTLWKSRKHLQQSTEPASTPKANGQNEVSSSASDGALACQFLY